MQSIRSLFVFNPISRPPAQLALNAFAMALPLLLGQLFNLPVLGLIACMGAIITFYAPAMTSAKRYQTLLLISVPFVVSFGIGAYTQPNLWLSGLSLFAVTVVAMSVSLTLKLPPPGSFFFIMVCCLAKTHPFHLDGFVLQLVAFFAGSLFGAVLVALYDVLSPRTPGDTPSLWHWTKLPVEPISVIRSIIAGSAIGGSFVAAELAGYPNAYWVPITAAAILQGNRFTDFWQRSLHRTIGTALGMLFAIALFAVNPSGLFLVCLLFVLAFVIEMLITRNYAVACIFITPLTVILAHTVTPENPMDLASARLLDVVIGSLFGLIAGIMIKLLLHRYPQKTQ